MNSPSLPKLHIIADLDYVGGTRSLKRYLLTLAQAARRFDSQLAIQVRAKNPAIAALEGIARTARQCVGEEALLVLNGPEQLAAALGYDGVHWPESAIPEPAFSTTTSLPRTKSLAFRSAAVHALAAVRRAEGSGANALIYSPVFRPAWKAAKPAGLAALAEVAQATDRPVYALGGVNPDRVEACQAAGAYGVAVLSGLADAANPINACGRYLEKLQ